MKRPPKPSPSQIILSRSRSRFSNQSSIPDWIAIPSLPKSQDDKEENEIDENKSECRAPHVKCGVGRPELEPQRRSATAAGQIDENVIERHRGEERGQRKPRGS